MLDHSGNELYRCMITDVITLIEGYKDLWEADILSADDYSKVHEHCQIYLNSYLDKTKRNMNGKQFADLVKLIGDAKFNGIYTYRADILLKLETDFVSFQAENSYFTISDLLNLLIAFDRVSNVNNMSRLMETVITMLPQATKNSDSDILELFKILDRM